MPLVFTSATRYALRGVLRIQHALLLGRDHRPGGEHITRSKEVMASEFPELAERIKFHFPDETEKRHGRRRCGEPAEDY